MKDIELKVTTVNENTHTHIEQRELFFYHSLTLLTATSGTFCVH